MMENSTPFEAMKTRDQFILCKFVPRDNGKTDKLPVDHRTLKVFTPGAGWQQDPTAWTTFDNASFLAAQLGPERREEETPFNHQTKANYQSVAANSSEQIFDGARKILGL